MLSWRFPNKARTAELMSVTQFHGKNSLCRWHHVLVKFTMLWRFNGHLEVHRNGARYVLLLLHLLIFSLGITLTTSSSPRAHTPSPSPHTAPKIVHNAPLRSILRLSCGIHLACHLQLLNYCRWAAHLNHFLGYFPYPKPVILPLVELRRSMAPCFAPLPAGERGRAREGAPTPDDAPSPPFPSAAIARGAEKFFGD